MRTEQLFDKRANTEQDLKDQFYSVVNMPLQSVCTSGKFFGGEWLGHCGALDGHKYICLDKFYDDVQKGKCLIYSFGIANDWSFEEAMMNLGCVVRAFDPTIDGRSKPENDLVSLVSFFVWQVLKFHTLTTWVTSRSEEDNGSKSKSCLG